LFKLLFPYIGYLTALVVCGLAVWKGDRPLRLTAVVLIAAWAISPLVSKGHRHGLDYPVTVLDTNIALIFVWISMRWRRIWCAVLAALTILVVLIPIVVLADPEIRISSHWLANTIVSALQLVVMAVATVLTVRARRRADEGTLQP
jgi:peptidoglycan/LPS O-acetylase OafA/YrhL